MESCCNCEVKQQHNKEKLLKVNNKLGYTSHPGFHSQSKWHSSSRSKCWRKGLQSESTNSCQLKVKSITIQQNGASPVLFCPLEICCCENRCGDSHIQDNYLKGNYGKIPSIFPVIRAIIYLTCLCPKLRSCQ